MKQFLFTLLLSLVVIGASAVPAKRGQQKNLTLTDGTTVSAVLVGDEHGHYWLGTDGQAYQCVGDADVYEVVDGQQVFQQARQRRAMANERRSRRLSPRRAGESQSMSGHKKGLIILVNFSKVSFKTSNNNALYQNIANKEGYSSGKFKGSVRDYFYAQSLGQFELDFDVIGPVKVSKDYSYYGANDRNGNDQHPAEMVIEALKLADPEVNFADYDWDGDGTVEQVYVVYAGQGEADGGSASTIWPHEYTLSEAMTYWSDGTGMQTLDGVQIDTYACGPELDGTNSISGIGTMCHEFSHCLGYPDFYDTDYSGGQGMGCWDLMDQGSYNGDGFRPAGFTSYERWVAGWNEPVELTTTRTVTGMKSLQSSGESYVIYNPGNRNEYFLLENRQKTGWDASLPGAGLLILHVDYSKKAWADNTPNDNPSHQRMTWIPADNEYQTATYYGETYYTEEGMATDPYPYGLVNAFGPTTTPAASLYNKNTDGSKLLNTSVENITRGTGGTISFVYKGEGAEVAAPVFSPAGGRYTTEQTVSMSCDTEGADIYYTLDGTTPTAGMTAASTTQLYEAPITIGETTTLMAIAVKDGDESAVTTAKYTIVGAASNPDTKTFKRVAAVADLEPCMRYIVACGSKAVAASTMSRAVLSSTAVAMADDVITVDGTVAVFVVDGDERSGWTFKNEADGQYLYSTSTKNLAYGTTPQAWQLSDGTDGVVMAYGESGTMFYNASSPRFTVYTSTPTASMIQANLYMEYPDGSSGDDPGNDDPGNDDPGNDDPKPGDDVLAYYMSADGTNGASLKTAMSGIVYNRTELTYDALWDAFRTTDARSDNENKVWDMYSGISDFTFGTDQAGSYKKEGDAYNREHSFPQSWFGSSKPMYTDLHHIYPTDGYVNGMRSNYPLGETEGGNYTSEGGFSKVGACTRAGYSGKVFEPNDEYKGDLARTYFYMVTCYEEKLNDWYENFAGTVDGLNATIDGSKYPGLTQWQLEMLMEWAKNDPVSDKEVTRNNAVYALQKNRNPFIDYPGLEEYVWGSMTTTAFSYDHYVRPTYSDEQRLTLSFALQTATAVLGTDFSAPVLAIDPAGVEVEVSYSSSNPAVATVDRETGVVTLLAAGTTTISATFGGNDLYPAATASYVLTVKEEGGDAPVVDSNRYELVADDSKLAAGDKVLIAYTGGDTPLALGTNQKSNNREAVAVSQNEDGTLTPGSDTQVVTLETDGRCYLLNVGDGYLYAASSTANWLRTEAVADDNARATIAIGDGAAATIVFQGTNTRNELRFNENKGTPIFSCYAATSNIVTQPQIYRMVTETTDTVPGVTTAVDKEHLLTSNGNGTAKGAYTLDGRRVSGAQEFYLLVSLHRMAKGIYIVEGKKVVVK